MKKFFLALTSVVLLFSCGSKETEFKGITIKPESTEVSGDMEGCYKVVDKEYSSKDDVLTIELERTDSDLPFEVIEGKSPSCYGASGSGVYLHVGFGIEFLDKDGNILETIDATASGLGGCYSCDDPENLAKLKPGKKGSIRFSVGENVKDAVAFRISTAYEKVDNTSFSSESEDNDVIEDAESEYRRAKREAQQALDEAEKAAKEIMDYAW